MLSMIHSTGDQLIIILKKLREQNFSFQLSVQPTPIYINGIYIKLNHNINLRISGNINLGAIGGVFDQIVVAWVTSGPLIKIVRNKKHPILKKIAILHNKYRFSNLC